MFCVNLSPAVGAQPISPEQYQQLIGTGLDTHWLKTKRPMKKYSEQNIIDVRDKGFKNLRLRCRADLYSYNYSAVNFTWFLGNLTTIVDHCLKHNVTPIITWIHHRAEAYATENDRNAYVNWWTAVARQLKDKDYKLSFNLFTELGADYCRFDPGYCRESLRRSPDKYNRWTRDVKDAIRKTGGKNAKRILILGSPGKTGEYLPLIDPEIYSNDSYTMAEWHLYAAGPNKKPGHEKFWIGDGTVRDKVTNNTGQENVKKAINYATNFTETTGLLTYLAEWQPKDNKNGSLTEEEAIHFARFFVTALRNESIPWSLNVLHRYYDTQKSKWLTKNQIIKGQLLNMSRVLDNILEVMP